MTHRLALSLLACLSLGATDRYVCHVNPPTGAACSTYSPLYNTVNAALSASTSGDRILVVPRSGSCTEPGHTGAHCGGDDVCTAIPATIDFPYSKSGVTLTTSRFAELPAAGTRITPDYINGASPILAEIRNPVGFKVNTMFSTSYGNVSCNALRARRMSSGASGFVHASAIDDQWNIPISGFGKFGDKLMEDSSTGYHYAFYAVSGTSTNYASVLVGRGLQRQVALCFGVPSAGHCAIANPDTGALVGACSTLTSCGLDDWGVQVHHLKSAPAGFATHYYKLWIKYDSAISGDSNVYVALANAGNMSYTGDGTSAAYASSTEYVGLKVTDPDYGSVYKCPAHDITIRGLNLTGGGDGTPYPYMNLSNSSGYNYEFAEAADAGYNLTIDQNIISNTYLELTRNPILSAGRHVNITNNWFATSSRSGSDGSVCCGQIQGPGNLSNNYIETLPSGFGVGGTANPVHTFPASIYEFPQTCCSMGWNGTIDIKHNWFWKPERSRLHLWTPNYLVEKESMWVPSASSNGFHFVAQTTGVTGATEPAWSVQPGASISDGTVTWKPESDAIAIPGTSGACGLTGWNYNGTWECHPYVSTFGYGNPSLTYKQGAVISAGGNCHWMATNAGTAAGTQGSVLGSNCHQGDTVVDGAVTWRGMRSDNDNITNPWEASKPYLVGDRLNYPAGFIDNNHPFYFVASVAGTSGSTSPTWSSCATQGCTITDGGVTWVGSLVAGNAQTTKNNMDFKEGDGVLFRYNYSFNAFPQNISGGSQGNCGEWSSQPSAGGPWEKNNTQVIGNVFDKCTVGLLAFGGDPGVADVEPSVYQCHTQLSGALNNSATSFTVVDGAHLAVGVNYRIDGEWITVNAFSGNNVTSATRGILSSTPASHSSGANLVPSSPYYDPYPACFYSVNPGSVNGLTFRHNRITNTMQGLNRTGCDLPFACPGSSEIALGVFSLANNVTVDHNLVDGAGVSHSAVSIGDAGACTIVTPPEYFANNNDVFSNNLFNPGSPGGVFFRSSCWGDDFPALNANWTVAFVPATHVADGWPGNFQTSEAGTKTYFGQTVNEMVYGNLFVGGTLHTGPTATHQTQAGKLPTGNSVVPATWAAIGFPQTSINGLPSNYTIPPSSPAYHIAGDGTNPGPDTDQQGLINNVTASSPSTTATICYDLTSVNSTVPVMMQLSTVPDFTTVPAQVDPSLVAPVAGVTVNSSNFTGYPYTSSGTHHCFVVPGLTASTKYYYRLHAGGQVHGIYAENNPPPSFTAGVPTPGTISRLTGRFVGGGTIR